MADRAGMWDRLAGVAGFVLLISVFVPFYYSNEETFSAWSAFKVLDKLLLVTALLGIALPVVAMLKAMPAGRQKFAAVTVGIALLALLGTVIRLFNKAEVVMVDVPIELRVGAFLVVASLLAMLACAVLAMRERREQRVAPARAAEAS